MYVQASVCYIRLKSHNLIQSDHLKLCACVKYPLYLYLCISLCTLQPICCCDINKCEKEMKEHYKGEKIKERKDAEQKRGNMEE